jgi:dTDP-4-dehydrorhamnose reductase
MRCLIIGADGSFGGPLSLALGRLGHEVIATTRRRANVSSDCIYLDLAETPPELPGADVAVICAAMARFDECRRAPELAYRVNVAAPFELSRSLMQARARVILLSTSAVFDGGKPYVCESDRPMPRSAYGRLKAEAEARLLEFGPALSVLRLTKVLKPRTGLLSQWIARLGEGESVSAFDDHHFCPLQVADVIDAVVAVIESKEGGIFHVSGAADISYFEAARFLARRIGVAEDRVEAVHAVENGLDASELLPFSSLATDRLSRLTGFVPLEPFDVLQRVYAREIDAARDLLAVHEDRV